MIRRLARCIREYKWAALLSPLCMVGEVAMEVLIPLVMADLYDYGIKMQDMQVVAAKSGILVLCALASLSFGVLSAAFASKAGTGFAKNLRHDMYHQVQDFSFSNIDKFSTASIVTRLTSDVATLQNTFQMMIRMAIRCPMVLILALVSAMGISVRLSLVYCVALPILICALLCLIPKVFRIFDRVFRTYDKMNNVVQENVHGIRVVKSFVREDRETEKFTSVSGTIYKDFCKAERIMSLANPIMQLCVYGCMLAISWIGAHLVIASGNNPDLGLTTGQLSSMFTYTSQILSSLMMLSMVAVMLTMSRAPLKRCYEILTEEPNLTSPTENAVMEVPDGSIDFENVSFRYSTTAKHRALKEVNLHIPSGATVGILGGTGSSKTTLVQLIPRLYDVSEGTLKVGGIDVRKYDLEVLRDNVAMVLQKNELFSGTIKENLRWGNPNATDEELVHACRLACADEFIRSFPDGYDTHIEQGGTNVSGGQKQRLCIARALLKKPKILILDDSTSAVDTRTDAMIRQAFREEIPGTTKLIIAQRIASVQDADIIVVLDNGMVKDVGTHESLLASSKIYQEVYYSQQKGGKNNASCQNARRRPQSQEPQEDPAAAAGLHEALSSHSGCGAAVHHCQRRRPDHRQPLPRHTGGQLYPAYGAGWLYGFFFPVGISQQACLHLCGGHDLVLPVHVPDGQGQSGYSRSASGTKCSPICRRFPCGILTPTPQATSCPATPATLTLCGR